jgi:AraC family transcriptional regulator, transcriptional activator of pobA
MLANVGSTGVAGHGQSGPLLCISGLMKPSAPIAVAFREVRHFKPDDCLHCEGIEVRGALHDWTIPAHRHEGLHQFQWLRSGAAEIVLAGHATRSPAPSALLLPAGCVHAFRYDPDSTGLQVTVPTVLLERAFAGAPALVARLAQPQVLTPETIGPGAAAVAAVFEGLAAEFERAEPGRIEALQAHAVLLATWFLRQPGAASLDEGRQALRDTLVQRATARCWSCTCAGSMASRSMPRP